MPSASIKDRQHTYRQPPPTHATHQITQELTPPHPHSPQKGKSKATPPPPRPPPIEEEAPDEGVAEAAPRDEGERG
eukprot:scaffold24356_cov140-Isochrysis_galbana.AAC.1